MATLSAQDGGPVKITSDVRVVEVDISVRDAQGKAVEGLQANDFTILDNGQPRPFTIFNANGGAVDTNSSTARSASPVSSPPLPPLPPNTFTNTRVTAPPPPEGHSTILLLDGVNAYFDSFAYGVQAVEGLMARVPPDEKIAVYVVAKNQGMIVVQDFTTDRDLLKKKVASFIPRHMTPAPLGKQLPDVAGGLIRSNTAGAPPRPSLNTGGPNPRAAPPDLDPLQLLPQEREFDALRATEDLRASLKALAAKLRKIPGRKSVFWITEGFPPTLLRNMNDAWDGTIAALNDANVQVNTVDACDNGRCKSRLWGPSGGLGQQEIAQRTGGTAYGRDLAASMASGIADSRSSYTLGFYLTEMDGKYHELKVRVDRPGVQLNQRQGYYAQTEAVAELAGKKVDLESALLSAVDSTEVGITAGFDIASASPHNFLNVKLKLDPESLSMVKKGEGWTGQIDEMFVQFNEGGGQVGRQSDKKRFEITAAEKPKFDSNGLTLPERIPMEAGAVKLRIIVRDTVSGRTGTLTVPLGQVLH